MRLTVELLAAPAGAGPLPVHGPGGQIGQLWCEVLSWHCSDGILDCQILAPEPVRLPGNEPSEPLVGALARLGQALHGHGALLLLRQPAATFSRERLALASGIRLFAIATEADEACWDAMLSMGQPVYGIRGTVAAECMSLHPAALISAIAYGNFTCEEGLSLAELHEDRQGVAIAVSGAPDDRIQTQVIIRNGFEAARLHGGSVHWRDLGTEGYVRLRIQSPTGMCWTQPRFIAPASTVSHHHG